MAAYCFFDILEVTDPQKFAKYREGVFATVEGYEGVYRVLGGKSKVKEGSLEPGQPASSTRRRDVEVGAGGDAWTRYPRVIIEFPSMEQAERWYHSPEYAPLLQLRLESSRGNAVFIEGRG